MMPQPTAAAGAYPLPARRPAAESPSRSVDACGKCGAKLEARNSTGFCKQHLRPDNMRRPDNFAELAAEHPASALAELLGVKTKTVRKWAQKAGIKIKPGQMGGCRRPPKPAPVAAVVTPQRKSWCSQCERRVLPAEAAACRSQFCKVRGW